MPTVDVNIFCSTYSHEDVDIFISEDQAHRFVNRDDHLVPLGVQASSRLSPMKSLCSETFSCQSSTVSNQRLRARIETSAVLKKNAVSS